MIAKRPPLGSLLQRHGIISDRQLQGALEHQRARGGKLGEALIALGLCSELDIARVLAEQVEIPFVDLRQTPPTSQALSLVSEATARAHSAVPVRVDGRRLLVAARNPFDIRIDEVMRRVTSLSVVVAAAVESQIQDVLARYEELKGQAAPEAAPMAPGARVAEPELIWAGERPETVALLDGLIADAVRRGASGFHLEPEGNGVQVRYRLDGVMVTVRQLSPELGAAAQSRVRLMCGLGAGAVGEPREGRAGVRVDGRTVELRVSCLPGSRGEILVCRMVDSEQESFGLEDLGLVPDSLQRLRGILTGRHGLLLIAGPGGSGKTTTLRALVREVGREPLHAVAVEEQVEVVLPGVHQLSAARCGGSLLRALECALLQEPDVVMVGDLPDAETADLASRAAAQGRMLLSAVTAHGALDALDRLLDLGTTPARVANSLIGILAQRLVPRVCEQCAEFRSAPPNLWQALEARGISPAMAHFRLGRGCAHCLGRGVHGRVAVHELLLVDEDLRYLIAERRPPSLLHEHARPRLLTMASDALQKCARGLIPPQEALRVT